MVGEDAEAAGEGGDVDLLDVGVRVVHGVGRGEGERHLGHAASLFGDERGNVEICDVLGINFDQLHSSKTHLGGV